MGNFQIFNQAAVEANLNLWDVMKAVEKAYLLNARKETTQFPTVVHFFPGDEGDMDIKSGAIDSQGLLGMKMITYMEHNPSKGLPPLMGCLMLFDRETGTPLALCHAASVTNLRTGAAAGIGVKYLAREDAETMLLVGCGEQAAACAAAALMARPKVKRLLCCCRSVEKAAAFAAELPQVLAERYLAAIPQDSPGYAVAHEGFSQLEITGTTPEAGTRQADIILTVTPSREPILRKEWLKPGVHLSCMGADMEGKQEVEEAIVAQARVFCDDIAKTSRYGEMATAIRHGTFTADRIAGELGQIIEGTLLGRTDPLQITLFDSSGIAPQDLLSAGMLLQPGCHGKAVDF